jgi:diaminopropionate ammonia-lyase
MGTADGVEIFRNPKSSSLHTGPFPKRDALEFHKRLPGYQRTPLIHSPELAALLQVGEVWVKDESSRVGLPSFKILGASWAVYQALLRKLEHDTRWSTIEELRASFAPLRPLTLVAATDGNHGRAVAHVASWLGFEARIFVPIGIAAARIKAIESEGAAVIVVDGNYDAAVEQSAKQASERTLVLSDTAWPGYEEIPRWVIEGYSTILWEVDDELAGRETNDLDLVAVQVGVGGLATAVVQHFRRRELPKKPRIVSVEPMHAACVLASARERRLVSLDSPLDSIMAGLNCGTPSLIAWPVISTEIDLFAAISDEYARQAMRAFARAGVISGETGAAGLAGLLAVLAGDTAESRESRNFLGIHRSSCLLVISTEGATDPESYEQIVGRKV